MRRTLIITADDFGLDERVNGAVQSAATKGVLSAASLMVGAPRAAEAVRMARALPRLRIGLHLVLTDGCSVLPPARIPELVGVDGRFRHGMLVDALRQVASPRVRRQLAAEIRAQFQTYGETGLPLDHVNAHKHFHLHPGLLLLILEIGAEYGVRAVRVPAEPLWFARRHGSAPWLAAAALRPWVSQMKRRLLRRGMLFNDQVFGISCSGRFDEATLLQVLSRLPPGITELYLHPALPVGEPRTTPGSGYRHEQEWQALLSPRVREAVLASGAKCGGFADARQPQDASA